jgi:hypothetical protein
VKDLVNFNANQKPKANLSLETGIVNNDTESKSFFKRNTKMGWLQSKIHDFMKRGNKPIRKEGFYYPQRMIIGMTFSVIVTLGLNFMWLTDSLFYLFKALAFLLVAQGSFVT